MSLPSIQYPKGYYDPPEGILHCECPMCEIPRCGAKNENPHCQHGEDDAVCDHKFCCECGILLRGEEVDMCDIHQILYDAARVSQR